MVRGGIYRYRFPGKDALLGSIEPGSAAAAATGKGDTLAVLLTLIGISLHIGLSVTGIKVVPVGSVLKL